MDQLPTKDDVRLYSVEEANELVPEVRERIGELREAVHGLHQAQQQAEDLEEHWPQGVGEAGSGVHEAYQRLRQKIGTLRTDVDEHLLWFQDHGVEVKDPILGLVDFYHERGDGELVYLCWQQGEEELAAWHGLTDGFRGRRPLGEL